MDPTQFFKNLVQDDRGNAYVKIRVRNERWKRTAYRVEYFFRCQLTSLQVSAFTQLLRKRSCFVSSTATNPRFSGKNRTTSAAAFDWINQPIDGAFTSSIQRFDCNRDLIFTKRMQAKSPAMSHAVRLNSVFVLDFPPYFRVRLITSYRRESSIAS